ECRLTALHVDEIHLQRFGNRSSGHMARQSSKAENSNQPRTHRLTPDGEVAEDYFTGRRTRVPNSSKSSDYDNDKKELKPSGQCSRVYSASSVVESGKFLGVLSALRG